jgi:uncharacterized membrane protein YadS
MAVLPGLLLALIIAFAGHFLSNLIGITWMGLPKSPVSAIMMAILLGILIRNTVALPAFFQAGIRFGLVRVLRLGIILLGIRLSLGRVGAADRHVFRPQARVERQARYIDSRRHKHLRCNSDRRHGTCHRGAR